MPTDMKRFTISATPEMIKAAEELKKCEFYNKTYAEMYRHILLAGLDSMKANSTLKVGVENKISAEAS